MQLDKKLYDDINEYCKENSLKTRDFIHKILKEAFLKEKYGDSPFIKVQMTKTAEAEACEKIKDLIENQVSVPPEIMEIVDEHFFEMLDEPKTQKQEVVEVTSMTEPIINDMKQAEEAPKPKKKRKLN
jgi:hypothetical protein